MSALVVKFCFRSASRVLGRPDYDTLWDRFIPALSPAPPRRAARPQRARQRAAHRLAFASNGTSSKKEILSWQDLVRSGRLSRAQDREDPAAPHLRKVRVKHLVAQPAAYTLRIRMPCTRTGGCNGCIIAQDMSADRGSTRTRAARGAFPVCRHCRHTGDRPAKHCHAGRAAFTTDGDSHAGS